MLKNTKKLYLIICGSLAWNRFVHINNCMIRPSSLFSAHQETYKNIQNYHAKAWLKLEAIFSKAETSGCIKTSPKPGDKFQKGFKGIMQTYRSVSKLVSMWTVVRGISVHFNWSFKKKAFGWILIYESKSFLAVQIKLRKISSYVLVLIDNMKGCIKKKYFYQRRGGGRRGQTVMK